MSLFEGVKHEVEEVVHKVEEVLNVGADDKPVDPDEDLEKLTIYLNQQVDSREVGPYVEDYPVWRVTEVVIDHLNETDQMDDFKGYLTGSKADGKAYLNRAFDFRRHYTKKEEGAVYFYSKAVAYPPANLINDLEYDLGVERG